MIESNQREGENLLQDIELAEIDFLRREVARLQQQTQELQLRLKTAIERGDTVEAELQEVNQKLQGEIDQHQQTQGRLQELLDIVSQDKRDKEDLEIRLQTATEHGDTVEFQLYNEKVEAMRQSKDLFRAIAESTPVAMLIADIPKGKILYANSTTAELLGVDFDALRDRFLRDLYDDPNQEEWLFDLLNQQGYVHNHELQIKKEDGTLIWAIASLQKITMCGTETWLITFYNITERKQMEEVLRCSQTRLRQQMELLETIVEHRTEQLRRSEEKYRTIVENAVEGVCQMAPDGHYLTVNHSLARLYGYESPADLMKNLTDISQHLYVQRGRWDELQVYVQQFNSVPDFKSQVYRKDGSIIWISESLRAVRDQDGTLLYYEGTVRDVTEQKQTEAELRQQRQITERLLLNILPQKIAERLKRDQGKIAANFEESTVLFADIVNFTQLTDSLSPIELVEFLNQVFSAFDALVDRYGLEKIKTIGDAYMAVGGLPSFMPDHVEAIANLALGMQKAIAKFPHQDGQPCRLRIGIHTGPVVAGVIGRKKFIYDLWGNTVNIASRMESQGQPGKIQVTAAVYERLKHRYKFEERGTIQVKGKGEMITYWLKGKKFVNLLDSHYPEEIETP